MTWTHAKEIHKMRAAVVLALVLLSVFSAKGQPSDANHYAGQTNGRVNGRFWKSAPEAGKQGFVTGYAEALTTASLAAITFEALWPAKLTVRETMAALDKFYDTPENAPIPISSALIIVAARADGVDEAKIQKEIAKMRKDAGTVP
jgi:hypothetical protein